MSIENDDLIIREIFSQYSVKTLDDAKNLPFEVLDIPIRAESYCRNNNLKTLYDIASVRDIYDLESRSKARCCWSIHKYFNWIQDALLQYGLRFAMNDDDWKEWWKKVPATEPEESEK